MSRYNRRSQCHSEPQDALIRSWEKKLYQQHRRLVVSSKRVGKRGGHLRGKIKSSRWKQWLVMTNLNEKSQLRTGHWAQLPGDHSDLKSHFGRLVSSMTETLKGKRNLNVIDVVMSKGDWDWHGWGEVMQERDTLSFQKWSSLRSIHVDSAICLCRAEDLGVEEAN